MRTTMSKLAGATFALALGVLVIPATAYASGTPGGFPHQNWRGNGSSYGQGRAVVSVESGMYGPVLVVGGAGAGYDPTSQLADPQGYLFPPGSSLYTPTIDPPAFSLFGRPYQAGCDATTQAVSVIEENGDPAINPPPPPYPPFTCTGSETDATADWPALTTQGPPIAGPGVNPFLLGSVYRSDLGTFQVTYAGHPLYLFDPGPESFAGEDFFESVAPLFPWHTAWYLVSPSGQENPGPATLETEPAVTGSTTFSSEVIANAMLPVFGGVPITVYSFSGDLPWLSLCYGQCATEFMPVITNGPVTSNPDANPSKVATIRRFDGTWQVTYGGHPLYMYDQEQPIFGTLGPQGAGNANGMHAFGGTFSVVSP